MIKIAEIWGLDFANLANELEHSTAGVTHIVLDFLCEIQYKLNHPSYDKILDIAHRDNIPVTILTPYLREMPPLLDFNNPKYKNITMIHWETFWFNRTYEAWKQHDKLNKEKNLEMFNLRSGEHLVDFKYSYITLNNISKNHRCHIMDLLAKHNLIEHGAIAWRDIRRDCDDIRHTFPDNITDSAYRNYPYKYWKPKRLILDQDINSRFLQETLPIEFNESFMQLVTESDNEVIFFSEKTATPILLNKLFLLGGAKDNHLALKNRGFELYDEIFDYGFDSEKDDNLRYEGLVENIKKINSLPKSELTKIYKSLFEKIVHNKKHAVDLINIVPKQVIDLLSLIRKENQEPYNGPLNMLL
jgi:DNA-directed RNA polymerase subunit F